jgi:DNA processing protein
LSTASVHPPESPRRAFPEASNKSSPPSLITGEVGGISQTRAERWQRPAIFRRRSNSTAPAELGITLLCPADAGYPLPLKNIDPPLCLYVRGEILQNAVAIAVVGSRTCSTYGRFQIARFRINLAQAGFTVVSGLARGVDGARWMVRWRPADGRSPFGNGLSSSTRPNMNRWPTHRRNGAVIRFPSTARRRKLQSKPNHRQPLLGVLVVEAASRSGL